MSPRNSYGSKHPDLDLEKTGSVLVHEDLTAIAQKNPTTTITAPDWDGPDDPDNPRTWSLRKRLFHSTIPGLFNFVV